MKIELAFMFNKEKIMNDTKYINNENFSKNFYLSNSFEEGIYLFNFFRNNSDALKKLNMTELFKIETISDYNFFLI